MIKGVQQAGAIDESNVTLNEELGIYEFSDEAALKLVIADTDNIDAWMNLQQWSIQWLQSDTLQQSPQTAFDGIAGMTVPKFTLSNVISAVVPKIMGSLFYDDPPFVLRPRPGTSNDVVRAKTALFAYQLDEMNFEEEIEAGLQQMALYGTGIWKWGWKRYKKTVKKYVREADEIPVNTPFFTAKVRTPSFERFKAEISEVDVEEPWLKMCDLRTVLVSTDCRRGDIRTAKAVTFREYPTWREIEDLRDVEGYNIPSEQDMKDFFLKRQKTTQPDNLTMTLPENMRGYLMHALPRNYKSTEDPFQNGPELLERVDNEKVITVLRLGPVDALIRNEPNEFGCINAFSCNWRNLNDAFYGQGLGQLVGPEQMVEQGVNALALGMLAYGLQPTAIRKEGFNAISQPTRWEQGGIITVQDDVDKAFKFLEFPQIPAEAWQMVALSKADSAETSGANQQITMGSGAAGIHTTGLRNATSAGAVIAANASRLDGPAERFIRQVFVPWLYKMDELNNDKLPTSVLMSVLGEKMGKDFKIDQERFRNGKVEFDVLAGAHLGAKKEMAQFMPFIITLASNPTLMELAAEQGWILNYIAWFNQFADLAGFKFAQDFFVKMTPEQQKRRMLNSPAGAQQVKGQQAQQSQLAQFQHEETMQNSEQMGKAAIDTLKLSLEHTLNAGDSAGAFGADLG